MKKLTLLICALALISASASAQFKLGLKAGFNNSQMAKDFYHDGVSIDYSKGQVGFHFGLTSQIEIVNFYIQPELLFSTNTNDIHYRSIELDEIGKQRFNKLDIPVLVGIKLGPAKIGAGPVFTNMLNSKSDLLDRQGIEQTFSGMTMGYQIGGGLEFGKFSVEARYEGNLSKYGSGMKIGNSTIDFDQRISQWLFSVGYYF